LGEIISRGVANSGMAPENIYVCKTNSEAAEILLKNIKTDDAVLIKGSRGIKMEEIVNFVLAED